MFRLLRIASYALLGYVVYELVQGVLESEESPAPNRVRSGKRTRQQKSPPRRPLRNEPGRGVTPA
jgi:hypothetical protein